MAQIHFSLVAAQWAHRGPLLQSCSGVAVTPKTLQVKEDGSLFYSTLSQASPFACCLCKSQTSSTSEDGKFDASLAKVPTTSLLGNSDWLGIR